MTITTLIEIPLPGNKVMENQTEDTSSTKKLEQVLFRTKSILV